MISNKIIVLVSGCCFLALSACSKRGLPQELSISGSFFLGSVDNVSGQDFYLLDGSHTVIVPSRITHIGIGDGMITGKVVDQFIPAMPRLKDGYFIVIPGDGVVASGLEYEDLANECRKFGYKSPPLESPANVRTRLNMK